MKRVAIKSLACQLPKETYKNNDPVFKNIKNVPLFWWSFWGVNQRGYFNWRKGENETSAAISVCEKAIRGANLIPKDIDIVICSSSFPLMFGQTNHLPEFRVLPRLSAAVKEALGIFRGIDVQADCLSFLANLELAASLIRSGMAKHVLICSSEYFSAALDMKNPVSTIFGDGAAAAVMSETTGAGDLLASHFRSDATHYELAVAKLQENSGFSRADSGEKFWGYFTLADSGAKKMSTFIPFAVPKIVKGALAKKNLDRKDIDHFIFHQPSKTIVKAWAAGLGVSKNKYSLTMEDHGVLVSVSIPLTLLKALREGKIKPGAKVVIAGAATGWNFGAQVWQFEDVAVN